MMNEVLGHDYSSRQEYEQSREVEGLKKIVADLSEDLHALGMVVIGLRQRVKELEHATGLDK